jgi:hypothetical protein
VPRAEVSRCFFYPYFIEVLKPAFCGMHIKKEVFLGFFMGFLISSNNAAHKKYIHLMT